MRHVLEKYKSSLEPKQVKTVMIIRSMFEIGIRIDRSYMATCRVAVVVDEYNSW